MRQQRPSELRRLDDVGRARHRLRDLIRRAAATFRARRSGCPRLPSRTQAPSCPIA